LNQAETVEALLDLARDVDLEVRIVGPPSNSDGEPPPASGVCRVKGRIWVVLASAEPAAAQIAMLATALRQHRGDQLENRYLSPALRAVLEG
jgi:hypothetical protein